MHVRMYKQTKNSHRFSQHSKGETELFRPALTGSWRVKAWAGRVASEATNSLQIATFFTMLQGSIPVCFGGKLDRMLVCGAVFEDLARLEWHSGLGLGL